MNVSLAAGTWFVWYKVMYACAGAGAIYFVVHQDGNADLTSAYNYENSPTDSDNTANGCTTIVVVGTDVVDVYYAFPVGSTGTAFNRSICCLKIA